MLRRIPTEVAGSEKLMTTAVAVSRPTFARIDSSAESPDDRVAGLARGGDSGRVEIERDVLEALRFKHPRHVLSDAPEAAENYVISPSDVACRTGLALECGAGWPGLTQQETRDALVDVEDERAQHHREHDGQEQRLAEAARDEAGRERDRAEGNSELAADRDDDAGAQCLEARAGKGAAHQRGDRGLQDDDGCEPVEDLAEFPGEEPHIEKH